MFEGHTILTLDAKSRLVFPSKFRKVLKPEADNKLVLTRGLNKSIMLYPLDEWERVKKGLMNFNIFNSRERQFMRKFMMFVNPVELDSHHRILLPSQLLNFASIEKDVLLLGMLNVIEIWNPKSFDDNDTEQDESFEDLSEKVTEIIFNKNKQQ